MRDTPPDNIGHSRLASWTFEALQWCFPGGMSGPLEAVHWEEWVFATAPTGFKGWMEHRPRTGERVGRTDFHETLRRTAR
jgi:hypothetical protein